MIKQANCPNCGKPADVSQENKWRPFCCERCKLIDLGAWMDESRRIPTEEGGSMEETDDINFTKH